MGVGTQPDRGSGSETHLRIGIGPVARPPARNTRKGNGMAAMKPRTSDGPMEVTKEGRGIIMRVPLEGGGRLVVELTPDEANQLRDELQGVVG